MDPEPEERIDSKKPSNEMLERCFEVCLQRAWRLAYSFVGDRAEAFDVVQQAFLVAARKPESVPSSDPWPWFSVVVAFEARNVRKKKRALTNQNSLDRGLPDENGITPEARAMANESASLLWRAVDRLPEDERDAVVLVHVNGMTHARAASSLGVPRQTLTSRLQRGLEHLRRRLGDDDEAALIHSLATVPVLGPAMGWQAATLKWKSCLVASPVGVPSVAAMGSVLAMKNVGLIVVAVMVFTAGWFSHDLVTQSLPPEDLATRKLAREEPTADGFRSRGVESKPSDEDVADTPPSEGFANLYLENKRLASDNLALQERVSQLKSQLDDSSVLANRATSDVARPVFTFGSAGSLDGVLDANWSELAVASMVVADSIRAVHEAKSEGQQAPREVMIRLQRNVERMRVYEYKVLDKIPSAAKHNGELTHPISLANLLAAILEEVGEPLTDRQVERIAKLGEQFEADFEQLNDSYPVGSLRAERMLEEYLLKGDFTDNLYAVLSQRQRSQIVDPTTHRRAFLDLYCPTLMIIHSSPVIAGATLSEIEGKLATLLRERYELPESLVDRTRELCAEWREHCVRLLEQVVPPFELPNYTYDESVIAGEATVGLLTGLLESRELSEASRDKILADPAFFIPRRFETPAGPEGADAAE